MLLTVSSGVKLACKCYGLPFVSGITASCRAWHTFELSLNKLLKIFTGSRVGVQLQCSTSNLQSNEYIICFWNFFYVKYLSSVTGLESSRVQSCTVSAFRCV